MNERICLITGATNGIGKETAIGLAEKGMRVVITTRAQELGERVQREIISLTGNPKVDVMVCELSSFISVISFCNEFKRRYEALHVLLNNAGVWESKRRLSRDGVEMTFAVNHLAPFLLTNCLLDLLTASATTERASRIVTVSSTAHKRATIDFDDIEGKRQFNGIRAYSQSKLANILFTKHLAKLLHESSANITANCLHPGVVNTNLFNFSPKAFQFFARPFMMTPRKGAEASIYLATSSEVEHISGEYFNKKKLTHSSKASYDEHAAELLWERSVQYVGL